MATIFSWIAFAIGLIAIFWAGTSKNGWLLNAIGAIFWILFGVVIHSYAEWIFSLIIMGLAIRNYIIWVPHGTMERDHAQISCSKCNGQALR